MMKHYLALLLFASGMDMLLWQGSTMVLASPPYCPPLADVLATDINVTVFNNSIPLSSKELTFSQPLNTTYKILCPTNDNVTFINCVAINVTTSEWSPDPSNIVCEEGGNITSKIDQLEEQGGNATTKPAATTSKTIEQTTVIHTTRPIGQFLSTIMATGTLSSVTPDENDTVHSTDGDGVKAQSSKSDPNFVSTTGKIDVAIRTTARPSGDRSNNETGVYTGNLSASCQSPPCEKLTQAPTAGPNATVDPSELRACPRPVLPFGVSTQPNEGNSINPVGSKYPFYCDGIVKQEITCNATLQWEPEPITCCGNQLCATSDNYEGTCSSGTNTCMCFPGRSGRRCENIGEVDAGYEPETNCSAFRSMIPADGYDVIAIRRRAPVGNWTTQPYSWISDENDVDLDSSHPFGTVFEISCEGSQSYSKGYACSKDGKWVPSILEPIPDYCKTASTSMTQKNPTQDPTHTYEIKSELKVKLVKVKRSQTTELTTEIIPSRKKRSSTEDLNVTADNWEAAGMVDKTSSIYQAVERVFIQQILVIYGKAGLSISENELDITAIEPLVGDITASYQATLTSNQQWDKAKIDESVGKAVQLLQTDGAFDGSFGDDPVWFGVSDFSEVIQQVITEATPVDTSNSIPASDTSNSASGGANGGSVSATSGTSSSTPPSRNAAVPSSNNGSGGKPPAKNSGESLKMGSMAFFLILLIAAPF